MEKLITDILMSYWFWGVIGFIAGSTLGVRNMVRNGCPFPVSVIMATAAVYGGLLGARSLYVLIYYPQMFQNDFIQAIAFWQSTGTWLGGPVAGILASWVVLKLAKVPFWSNAGSFVPGLVLAHIISRIGCLVNGCCYGAPTTVPWAIYSDRLQGTVHPTQIYSMLCELVVFIILQILWTKRESYRIYLFPLYGIMLPAHRFFTEFFRGCDTLPWIIPGLRTFQTISLFMFILFLSVLILMIWKKKGRVVVGFIAVTTIIAVSAANSDQIQHKYVKETPGQYIVVTRSVFENALEPWKKQKEKEGYSVVIHAWEKSPSAIVVKKQLEILTKKEIACIMVVGDSLKEPENNCTWDMPSIMRPSVLSTEKYAADSLFGDLDNDGLPDVPVGRLPVQTPEELNIQIDKIKKYSKQAKSNRYKGVVIWPLENNNIAFIKNIMPRGIPDVEILNNTEEKYRIFYNGNLKDIFLQRLGRATVRIITNRGVTHELVRHRLSSFSQESTRYVKYDGGMEFIKPVWIDAEINEAGDNFIEDSSETVKETAAICTWVESLKKDEKAYCSLLKDGWRPEQAREVLPNSLKTEIVMTANMREWRHVFNLRCSQAAHPQIRMIMLDMLNEFHEEFPGMFDDLAEQYLPNKCKAD